MVCSRSQEPPSASTSRNIELTWTASDKEIWQLEGELQNPKQEDEHLVFTFNDNNNTKETLEKQLQDDDLNEKMLKATTEGVVNSCVGERNQAHSVLII